TKLLERSVNPFCSLHDSIMVIAMLGIIRDIHRNFAIKTDLCRYFALLFCWCGWDGLGNTDSSHSGS
ncbi:hypothetical protein, partial [Vibrio anguillarum]